MTEIKRGLGSEYKAFSLPLSLYVAGDETQQQAI